MTLPFLVWFAMYISHGLPSEEQMAWRERQQRLDREAKEMIDEVREHLKLHARQRTAKPGQRPPARPLTPKGKEEVEAMLELFRENARRSRDDTERESTERPSKAIPRP